VHIVQRSNFKVLVERYVCSRIVHCHGFIDRKKRNILESFPGLSRFHFRWVMVTSHSRCPTHGADDEMQNVESLLLLLLWVS
jgi:hypothetical protein